MKVTKIITTASPAIGPCTRCNSDMASIYEIPGDKLKVRCLSCGVPVGDFATNQVYHKCPSCYEDRLNLSDGICESCNKEQLIDFDREAKVSYNDRERKYKHAASTIAPSIPVPEPEPEPEEETPVVPDPPVEEPDPIPEEETPVVPDPPVEEPDPIPEEETPTNPELPEE